MKTFGAAIKKRRVEKGLSQRALAERLSVNFTYLSKIESGEMAPPSEEVIRKMADALEMNQDELFALAKKVPAELVELAMRPNMPRLLRAAKDLSPEDLERIANELEKGI